MTLTCQMINGFVFGWIQKTGKKTILKTIFKNFEHFFHFPDLFTFSWSCPAPDRDET